MGNAVCMSDSVPVRCCGRAMTVIGVDERASALRLYSCPSCGRHSWRNGDREVDRSELLDTLRVVKGPTPPRRPAPARAEEPPAEDEDDRRADLQRLLSGFTAHGTSS